MNEWKELEIDNLPSDILTGGYEWEIVEYSTASRLWEHAKIIGLNVCGILENKLNDNREYRYRKPDPKAPSHEETRRKHIESLSQPAFYIDPIPYRTFREALLFILESAELSPEAKK